MFDTGTKIGPYPADRGLKPADGSGMLGTLCPDLRPTRRMTMPLQPGDPAPSFALLDETGRMVDLADLRGRSVVLYFYPKDDTPGCTSEACDFRDNMNRVTRQGGVVLGVSPDSAGSHQKFKQKYGLDFPLLVDADHAVAAAYGAWGEKKMYGKTREGIVRSTFLIDPEGRIARAWYKVKVAGHVDEVLTALKEL